jgi:hypothetical protein
MTGRGPLSKIVGDKNDVVIIEFGTIGFARHINRLIFPVQHSEALPRYCWYTTKGANPLVTKLKILSFECMYDIAMALSIDRISTESSVALRQMAYTPLEVRNFVHRLTDGDDSGVDEMDSGTE